MSDIWNELLCLQYDMESTLEQHATRLECDETFWTNLTWGSTDKCIARAHLSVVDARDERGLYMMHLTVVPVNTSNAPIFGFDIIAGKNKITGAFLDFSASPTGNHIMETKFGMLTKEYAWESKNREVPDWGRCIFSPQMVALGNIKNMTEVKQLSDMVMRALEMYLVELTKTKNTLEPRDAIWYHNLYSVQQRMNPHTPRVFENLGMTKEEAKNFVETVLFPLDYGYELMYK